MNTIRELEIEAAHADHMAEMAKYWMDRAQKAELEGLRVVARLALSNGGELRLKMPALMPSDDQITLERVNDIPTGDIVYRAILKTA